MQFSDRKSVPEFWKDESDPYGLVGYITEESFTQHGEWSDLIDLPPHLHEGAEKLTREFPSFDIA